MRSGPVRMVRLPGQPFSRIQSDVTPQTQLQVMLHQLRGGVHRLHPWHLEIQNGNADLFLAVIVC
jgi:hypothetical protein